MATVGGPDCASLESLTDFDDYVRRVRRETRFEVDLLAKCRVTICSAIWGDDNPDISGIGVLFTADTSACLFTWLTRRFVAGFNRICHTSRARIDPRCMLLGYTAEKGAEMGILPARHASRVRRLLPVSRVLRHLA